jgi:hypothetical protein
MAIPPESVREVSVGTVSRIFAISTRSSLSEQTLIPSMKSLSQWHSAQFVSSGVSFAVFSQITNSGLLIIPKVMLTMDSGEDVVLVEDRLGPLSPPYVFNIDFCIVDEGGRNVQLDVICRGDENTDFGLGPVQGLDKKTRTLMSCLQDYTSFNSHVDPSHISFGNSSLATHVSDAKVFLQNLVISEERLDDPPLAEPFAVGKEAARLRETGSSSNILFEGEDARIIAKKNSDPRSHPQIGGNAQSRSSAKLPNGFMPEKVSDFWHHIRYEDEDDVSSVDARGAKQNPITGEFWLSKLPVDKKNTYFHCSSTLGQALTMCVAFRFSCPNVHLHLISEGEKGARVLRYEHIPTNGVVMALSLIRGTATCSACSLSTVMMFLMT